VLFKTETMNEAEEAEFGCQNGMHMEQLKDLQEAFEAGDVP
jgi:hypothetical protein